MIDFTKLTGIEHDGKVVTQIEDASGRVLWMVSGGKVILEVEKITSDTYAGETTYTAEEFILLDIFPKTNGTVKVTYGGLTKTITDTSGAERPNAQEVFFGTFNGVSDSVVTPANGELIIEGNYYAFRCGYFHRGKNDIRICGCVTKIHDWGAVDTIPDSAFNCMLLSGVRLTGRLVLSSKITRIERSAFVNSGITSVVIGKYVDFIGNAAFSDTENDGYQPSLKIIEILATTPPEVGPYTDLDGITHQKVVADDAAVTIIVPAGCGEAYKTASGWSAHADLIVEAS